MTYTYKGYTIYNSGPKQWNISKIGDEDFIIDATNTLADARWLINQWHANA